MRLQTDRLALAYEYSATLERIVVFVLLTTLETIELYLIHLDEALWCTPVWYCLVLSAAGMLSHVVLWVPSFARKHNWCA